MLVIKLIHLNNFPFEKWWVIYMLTLLVLYLLGEIVEDFFKPTHQNNSKKNTV